MNWHVQYKTDGVIHVDRFRTPEAAIEKACTLLDDGHDVYAIGTGPLSDSISRPEIARIHALWMSAKPPPPLPDFGAPLRK